MILEVRHLRVLDAIVREGGVSRAAGRLNLTQPAVSHALIDLEDRLGVKLFERGARRMRPTAECERLLKAARIVLDELGRAEDDVAAIRDGQQGVLRITTQCYTCYHWLPRVLSTMACDFPKIDVQIVPEATRRPIEALLEESLDLAITHEVAPSTLVASERLFDDELVAIVAPGHRLAGRSVLEAADFADEHVILHSGPEDATLFQRVLRPAGVEPRRTSQLMLTEALVESVKAGLGVSVLARWAVGSALADGSLVAVRVTRGGLERSWYAAVLRRRRDQPALASLVALLKRDALTSVRACACEPPVRRAAGA